MCEDNRTESCLAEVLETILSLQQNSEDNQSCVVGCAKPFLGNEVVTCLNTRPIMLYCCCADRKWVFPATFNCATVECDVFRIENLNDNCATFRCLVRKNDSRDGHSDSSFVATDDFFTIDLNCVSAMKCLNDTNVVGL